MPLIPDVAGGPVQHLSWSPTGTELAVIDAVGRVSILTTYAALNKPGVVRNCSIDNVDDLNGVVGCFWLNTQRPVCISPDVFDLLSLIFYRQHIMVLPPRMETDFVTMSNTRSSWGLHTQILRNPHCYT